MEAWLAQRRKELLPVPYFHVVFTLPEALRRIVRGYPHLLYPILMRSAAESLQKLAADPRYIGGQLGILAVLHTWTRTLEYHPHVHCLIPGGGMRPDGTWAPARKDFLVPVRALSAIFRGKFMAKAKRMLPDQTWPGAVWKQDWVVYAKPTAQRPEVVLNYLGRYVHRVAIANSRLLSLDEGRVTFSYRRVRDLHKRTMKLSAHEFIRRFLQHVLPNGFHKVRYYGLWAPTNHKHLHRLREELATSDLAKEPDQTEQPNHDELEKPHRPESTLCPLCQKGNLRWVSQVPRSQIPSGARAPPLWSTPITFIMPSKVAT